MLLALTEQTTSNSGGQKTLVTLPKKVGVFA